jgi:hypothetical protein
MHPDTHTQTHNIQTANARMRARALSRSAPSCRQALRAAAAVALKV